MNSVEYCKGDHISKQLVIYINKMVNTSILTML